MNEAEHKRCVRCGVEASPRFAVGNRNLGLCERCADRMLACTHPEAERDSYVDGDGCVAYISRCTSCGFEAFDPLG